MLYRGRRNNQVHNHGRAIFINNQAFVDGNSTIQEDYNKTMTKLDKIIQRIAIKS